MQTSTQDLIRITSREKEVLFLISEEYTAQEIAKELFVSTHTVISHKKNLLIKLGARNGAGLIRRAFERGILTLPQYAA